MSELKQYEGAMVNIGKLMDVGFFTTVTKDKSAGTMGNGVFYGVKFVGKNNSSIAKAFNNANATVATQLKELVESAELDEKGRHKTRPVLIEAVAQEQSFQNKETKEWSNYGTQLIIRGIYEAPSMTKELWGYSE